MATTRQIISKSSKRKMTSEVIVPMEDENGKVSNKKIIRQKANGFTQMVVIHEMKGGVKTSRTVHEKRD